LPPLTLHSTPRRDRGRFRAEHNQPAPECNVCRGRLALAVVEASTTRRPSISYRLLRELQEVRRPALGECHEGFSRLHGFQTFREPFALCLTLRCQHLRIPHQPLV